MDDLARLHPDLQNVHRAASNLVRLLNDPQPGLATWNGLVVENMKTIRDLTTRGEREAVTQRGEVPGAE